MRFLVSWRRASLVITLLVLLAVGVALLSRTGIAVHAASASNAYTSSISASTFNSANFRTSTRITNPYLPFLPGTEYIYKGSVNGKPFYETVVVVDTDIGIAPEDGPHIFERFYRADPARTRKTGGSGLGLSIVDWVIHAHGGSIQVESQVGQGSTFTISLLWPMLSRGYCSFRPVL